MRTHYILNKNSCDFRQPILVLLSFENEKFIWINKTTPRSALNRGFKEVKTKLNSDS